MNPRRRVLLIAIASWAIIAFRAKSANPLVALAGLTKFAGNLVEGTAKLAMPIAKVTSKIIWKTLVFVFQKK